MKDRLNMKDRTLYFIKCFIYIMFFISGIVFLFAIAIFIDNIECINSGCIYDEKYIIEDTVCDDYYFKAHSIIIFEKCEDGKEYINPKSYERIKVCES